MARTEIAAQELPGGYDYDGANLTWTAADVANGNDTPCTGREIILVRNDDAGGSLVTIVSAADALGRTKDCEKTVAASEYAQFGPFPVTGWSSGGRLEFDGANANVMFAVLRLPSSWAGR